MASFDYILTPPETILPGDALTLDSKTGCLRKAKPGERIALIYDPQFMWTADGHLHSYIAVSPTIARPPVPNLAWQSRSPRADLERRIENWAGVLVIFALIAIIYLTLGGHL